MLDKYAIMAAWIVVIGLWPVATPFANSTKTQVALDRGSYSIRYADGGKRWNISCTEADIHQEARDCYYNCVTRYFNEQAKQQCVQSCVENQNAERDKCGVKCKNIGGYNICN
jgi:hypothetical protein